MNPLDGSHMVTFENGKVKIHGVELFVGFDPDMDETDGRMAKFDSGRVREIVKRTNDYIKKGQSPKLILGHNPKDRNEADKNPKPTIGDIPEVRFDKINGVPGIIGDVVMSRELFDLHVRSNSYPRRSAEIWPDGFMSEVALLGGQTPARPLPDTRFNREIFCRDVPALTFQAEPGPHTTPPRDRPMDDNKDDTTDKDKDKEIEKLKARCQELEDEKKKMKAARPDPPESYQKLEIERDQFARDLESNRLEVADLKEKFVRERFGRKVFEMQQDGYRVGGAKQVASLIDRLAKAEDPDSELEWVKSYMAKDPVGNHPIDGRHLRLTDSGGAEQAERERKASEYARDKCVGEGKHDVDTFKRYYEEGLQNTG